LVRRLCDNCKYEKPVDPETIEGMKAVLATADLNGEIDPKFLNDMKFYEGKGCPACNNTGYKGRVGLYEVLRIDNSIRKAIFDGLSAIEIQEIALKGGMLTLEQAGILKALEGVTSVDEVYRVAKKMETNQEKDADKAS